MASTRTHLVSGSALALLLALPTFAQDRGTACALVEGEPPPDCASSDAGDLVAVAPAPNLEDETETDALGDLGFSISIDSVQPTAPRELVAGDTNLYNPTRDIDRLLDAAGVSVSFDGLGAEPILNVSTTGLSRTVQAGKAVTFHASTNYPAWIARAEVRLLDRRTGRLVAALPVAPNGKVAWTAPAQVPAILDYVLRVADAQGRFDETIPLPLEVTEGPTRDVTLDGPVAAAGEGEDRTARRGIPIGGGAVTVSGTDLPAGTSLTVMGEAVPVGPSGAFVLQRILPPGEHDIRIGVQAFGRERTLDRDVTIPRSQWFATGTAEITLGRDLEWNETFATGRIAGYADGRMANGLHVTARVDTEEEYIEGLLGNLGSREPHDVLRDLDPSEVFVTTGDDSVVEDLAPSRGGVFVRVERGDSFAQWGDTRVAGPDNALVRTERSLYGLSAEQVLGGVTSEGEARARVSVFAAQPDTLLRRDRFRGTGGSSYFLSRRGLEVGTETVQIELRDPDTDHVVAVRTLALGRDYRINYHQGVVVLNVPLASSAAGGGLILDEPLGEFTQTLVVQYEFEPAVGAVDGLSAGARAEAWVQPGVRVGVVGITDTTGMEDGDLVGGDLFLRRSGATWLRAEAARSQGPLTDSVTFSFNGGLDSAEEAQSTDGGRAVRVEGALDLAEVGAAGSVSGYLLGREQGFSSPDFPETDDDVVSWGLSGAAPVTDRLALTFGLDHLEEDDGGRKEDLRAGLALDLSNTFLLETELGRMERSGALDDDEDGLGERTDLGGRLTWRFAPDRAVWVFGQATLDRQGTIEPNGRVGAGASARLTDALSFEAEASDGDLGPAAEAGLTYRASAGTDYTLGYRLDPLRARERPLLGTDSGSLVAGVTSTVNRSWTYQAENTWSAFGETPSLATTFGATYTPSEHWVWEGGFEYGETVEDDGTRVDRRSVSFGARFSDGEAHRSGFHTEVRSEVSDEVSGLDTETVAATAFLDRRATENWRFLADVELVVSQDDNLSFRDGRYVEASLGWAYRPIVNNRLTALLSYTYLEDLPGPDQVNVDGEEEGPLQRSHIINAALSYDLTTRWTIGAKYGFRLRDEAPREDTDSFVASSAHLGVLRLDYHIMNNWDLMAEGRAFRSVEAEATDYGALLAAYRHLGRNLRIGGGYAWGGVSDDLRTIKADREGVFINLIAVF